MIDLNAHVQINRKYPDQREGVIFRPTPSIAKIKSLEKVIKIKEINKAK